MTIDFHILKHRQNNEKALTRAVASLAIKRINPTVIENPGTVAEGRKKAYFETDALYVSYLDDDDYSIITLEQISKMVKQLIINKKPIYSNSSLQTRSSQRFLTGPYVKEWNLELEKRKQTVPHQTIIYETKLAQEIYTKAMELIVKNKWHENTIDFVMRSLVSREIGWTYFPENTYVWCVSPSGLREVLRPEHQKILTYFNDRK
jgi:hypothetical protein